MLFTPLASLALLALAPPPAQVGSVDLSPDLIEIAGEGHKRTIPCQGRRVEIQGTNHDITLTGVCAGLELAGVDNKVSITLTPDAVWRSRARDRSCAGAPRASRVRSSTASTIRLRASETDANGG